MMADVKAREEPRFTTDLSGQQFGELTVMNQLGVDDTGDTMWLCRCDCGNVIIVPEMRLVSHKIKHCSASIHHKHSIQLAGKRFGRLTVLREAAEPSKNGNVRWICRCDCGNYTEVDGYNLRQGVTRSCGCLRREISKETLKDNPAFMAHMGDNNSLKDENGVYISSLHRSKRNQSGVVGVSYDKRLHKWIARLRYGGKYVLNKSCVTFGEAVELRQSAEDRYFGHRCS